ncbi:hypothetical protein CL642_07745 [bacterium]|jgi:hypothetical protein|nr:hypothetical protein [bacterium]|tara:strand:- start:3928 stop:5568 length:1641 start_codon:yes stop_codon:yes gene_type:complete
MAKYARGKKSQAISDRSGLRVPYTQLKTTWDGLRVAPEDWEPKNPQLTPAKNVVDATALFNPRPDNDPENVEVFIGYNYDIFVDRRLTTNVGIAGTAFVGQTSSFEVINTSQTGVGGTAAVGSTSLFITTDVSATGLSGSGEVATVSASYLEYAITVGAIAAGNRYYVDSVLQQQLYLQEGQTYRFDQSASSNNGHPLRFSTTANGTHGGGSEYTTGVTTSGTPGNAGAYTEITVAAGAPTLYYYCTNHNLMGGTSYTPSSGTVSLAITVQSTAAGNRYYIDAGGPAPTISLTEGSTYRFDQSASSNNGHPLRFSTTANGTHGGGSEYTTGVTTSGTPGQANAYTQIVVADNAPTLYYYCTNHNLMGGQLNTPALTSSGGTVPVELDEIATGVGGSGSVGTGVIEGLPTATGAGGTASVGNVVSVEAFGWGIGAWGQGGWGDLNGSPHTAGLGGVGAVGIEGISADAIITETGVGGSGAVGAETINADGILNVSGTGGTAAVGSEAVAIDSNLTVSGLGGTGATGSEAVRLITTWGEAGYGTGQWN